jgi:histone-lysine N-methyltransferase SUV420H
VLEDDVCKALQTHAIVEKDAAVAQEKLLKLQGLAKYHRGLRTEDEREHFVRHLRKYVNIYLPDCPFEVGTTNRYTIQTAEACIIARKPIKKGEVVKYLSGIQVEMTEKEEEELSSRTDFSIVISTRRKRPSLFLGPARFANHDCDSNAKLNTTGPHGIHIVACKDIAVGDEITVVYGMDYFGEDNCECLCGTCERLLRNGWNPLGPIIHEDSSDEESESASVKPEERPTRDCSEVSTASKRKRDDVGPVPIIEETSARHDHGRLPKRPRVNDRNTETEESAEVPPVEQQQEVIKEEETPQDLLLRKIVNLLRRSADRPDPLKDSVVVPKSPESSRDGSRAGSYWTYPSAYSSKSSPQPAAVANNHFDARSTPIAKEVTRPTRDATMTSHLEVTKPNKLPSVKKIRSYSSLRTVTNAADSQTDPYSLQAMPPARPVTIEEPKPVKRGPGRPRKHPRPTQPDSSSSSAENTDASSNHSSGTSSMTSNEYVPGAIAQGICESLITGGDEDEDEKSPTKFNRTTRRSSPRSQTREDTPLRSPSKHLDHQRRSTRSNARSHSQTPTASLPHPIHSIEPPSSSQPPSDIKRGPPRTPKDYTLCRALLLTVQHRWVECRNCDEFFLQADAYQTRIACPRCERHSKLYGYHWPKTDREGKNDGAERILDHRLIHRFIARDEEKSERKGRKALGEILMRAASGSEDGSGDGDGDVEELRGGRRMRGRPGKQTVGRGRGGKVVRCSPRGREMRRSVRMTM